MESKNTVINRIYSGQKSSSKKRGHNMPSYTKDEFKAWIYSQQNFDALYNSWVESGYKKKYKPSCDRLDNSKGYTFENIRLVTWGENVTGHRYGTKKASAYIKEAAKMYDHENKYKFFYKSSEVLLDTVSSYAAKFNYCVQHVYKLIADGKLETHTIGKTRLIIVKTK